MHVHVRKSIALAAVAASLLAAPLTWGAAAETAPAPTGYCAGIKEFLQPQSAGTCAIDNGLPSPEPARIRQSIAAAKGQVAATVAVCNTGGVNLGRLRITGVPSNSDFRVRYTRADGTDITSYLTVGTYKTQSLGADNCFRYRIDVVRTGSAVKGDKATFALSFDPEGPGWATLKVATHITAS